MRIETRIGDQDIEPAKGGHRRGNHIVVGFFTGDVGLHIEGLAACLIDNPNDVRAIDQIGHDNLRTLLRQFFAIGSANAL